jgi:hypothetical protein
MYVLDLHNYIIIFITIIMELHNYIIIFIMFVLDPHNYIIIVFIIVHIGFAQNSCIIIFKETLSELLIILIMYVSDLHNFTIKFIMFVLDPHNYIITFFIYVHIGFVQNGCIIIFKETLSYNFNYVCVRSA